MFCLQDEELADVEGIANGSGFKARLLGTAEKHVFSHPAIFNEL